MSREWTGAAYASGRRRGALGWGLGRRTAFVRRVLEPWSRVLDVCATVGAMLDGVRASGIPLPFAPESFDIVICSAARKYVRDGAKLVRECLRFLGPGGSLAVVDPHPWALGLGVRLGKFDRGYLHHRSNAAEIAAEMQDAGFIVLHRRLGLFVTCVGKRPEAEPCG